MQSGDTARSREPALDGESRRTSWEVVRVEKAKSIVHREDHGWKDNCRALQLSRSPWKPCARPASTAIHTEPVKAVVVIRKRKTLEDGRAGMGRPEYQSTSSTRWASRAGEDCRPWVLITRARAKVSAEQIDSAVKNRGRDWEISSKARTLTPLAYSHHEERGVTGWRR